MGGKHHQLEPVRNLVNAIFDRHAGHGTLQSEVSLEVAYVCRVVRLDKRQNSQNHQGFHRLAIRRRQRRQHLPHRQPKARMHPVRGHIGQGHQHEGPVLQPRMRQDQPVGAPRAPAPRAADCARHPASPHRAGPNRPSPPGRCPASAFPSVVRVSDRNAPRPRCNRCRIDAASTSGPPQAPQRHSHSPAQPPPGSRAWRKAAKCQNRKAFFASALGALSQDRPGGRFALEWQVCAERNQGLHGFTHQTELFPILHLSDRRSDWYSPIVGRRI
jgi:hypothetical protein